MMVLQHSSLRKSLHWYVILFSAKVGIFSLSYAVIHSFYFSTFYQSLLHFEIFNILVYEGKHTILPVQMTMKQTALAASAGAGFHGISFESPYHWNC